MAAGQRRFSVMGTNAFKMADRLMSNQRLCRLLKYPCREPFAENLPDVNGEDLIHKQILIVPKLFDGSTEKMSYIVTVFDDFSILASNNEFKVSTVRFDVACPYDEWVLNDTSLRPYLIMQEIDNMFNQSKMQGIGNLNFWRADALTLSPWLGGYSMRYKINECN